MLHNANRMDEVDFCKLSTETRGSCYQAITQRVKKSRKHCCYLSPERELHQFHSSGFQMWHNAGSWYLQCAYEVNCLIKFTPKKEHFPRCHKRCFVSRPSFTLQLLQRLKNKLREMIALKERQPKPREFYCSFIWGESYFGI